VIDGTLVVGEFDTRTLRAALEVLPRRPIVVVSADAEAIASADAATRGARRHSLDAFVPVGSRVVYLRPSATLCEAEISGGPYVLMLASVIWHEMAHAEGWTSLRRGDAKKRCGRSS
jgi:hypothetical protein